MGCLGLTDEVAHVKSVSRCTRCVDVPGIMKSLRPTDGQTSGAEKPTGCGWWLDAGSRFHGDDRRRGWEPAHLAAAELWVSTGQCFMGWGASLI